jgi:hypothetical protein
MKHLLSYSFFALLSFSLFAQSYDLALGLRLGTEWGATAKLRLPLIDENFTLETILQSSLVREEGMFSLVGAQHFPVITRRLNLYAGGGLHAGWTTKAADGATSPANPVGITGIIGGELTLGRVNVSYDFKPAINLRGGENTVYSQTGISLRYAIAKRHDIWESPAERRRRIRRENREERRANAKDWQFWKRW